MKPIRKKEKRLTVEFYKQAVRFKNHVYAHMRERSVRARMYDDFLDMLLAAQNEKKPFAEVIPDYNEFLKSCIEGERLRRAPIRAVIQHRKPIALSAIATLTAAVLVCICLLSTGHFSIWIRGIGYVHKSKHYEHSSYKIDDIIEFSVDARTWANSEFCVYDNGATKIMATVSLRAFGEYGYGLAEGDYSGMNYMCWTIRLNSIGTIRHGFTQVVGSADHIPSTSFDSPRKNRAKVTYELGGITTDEQLSEDFTKYGTEMAFSISSHPDYQGFMVELEENDKLITMRTTEKIDIKISGLILNQWVRK